MTRMYAPSPKSISSQADQTSVLVPVPRLTRQSPATLQAPRSPSYVEPKSRELTQPDSIEEVAANALATRIGPANRERTTEWLERAGARRTDVSVTTNDSVLARWNADGAAFDGNVLVRASRSSDEKLLAHELAHVALGHDEHLVARQVTEELPVVHVLSIAISISDSTIIFRCTDRDYVFTLQREDTLQPGVYNAAISVIGNHVRFDLGTHPGAHLFSFDLTTPDDARHPTTFTYPSESIVLAIFERSVAAATSPDGETETRDPSADTSGVLEEALSPFNANDPGERDEDFDEDLRALASAFGLARWPSRPAILSGTVRIPPEIAAQVLENITRGMPWRPDLGRVGNVAWFVTEGSPHAGTSSNASIALNVELNAMGRKLVFREAQLLEIFERCKAEIAARAPQVVRSRRRQADFLRFLDRAAERLMWEEVGTLVRASPDGIGEVILENSIFSERAGDGRFTIVRDASRIGIEGGAEAVATALAEAGHSADPAVTAAAVRAAQYRSLPGRVVRVLRVGGRVLLVVAIAAEVYHIYHAENRLKATVSAVGGFGASMATTALFAELASPLLAMGPAGWVAYGVGVLVAGGVGYWMGSSAGELVYELVIE